MAAVVAGGRYMPTATSIGEGDLMRTRAKAKAMPNRMSAHGISPPTIPWAIWAMRPACGAGSAGSPIPMPPWRMLPSWRITIGKTSTNEVTTVATISATSIFQGVPPRICPTFRSWMRLPETQQAQQTTAATPSTAPTPASPVTPKPTISRAATISVERARPETGWFEPPTRPTRYPPTAENRKPVTIITTAATAAPTTLWLKW